MDIIALEEKFRPYPSFRLKQLKQSLFTDLSDDWDKITTLPKDLREELKTSFSLDVKHHLFPSKDNQSIKALLTLSDGKKVESVLMKHKDRNTVCLSSQVGCALKCAFCATGQMGFSRNLTVSEILNQILIFSRLLKDSNQRITNIVFMGMGEPFQNYNNVVDAVRYINQPDTFNIGLRKISVSTSGVIDGITKFSQEGWDVNLAVSLHASDDRLRTELMPINKSNPLEKLIIALRKYQSQSKRKIMFEYMMIKGVNDSESQARQLASLLKGFICVINLIPYNQTGKFKPSDSKAIEIFKKILESHHLDVTQRYRYGDDIHGACGQLANKNQ